MKRKKIPTLYLIIPCYNEEEVLPISKDIIEDKMKTLIKNKTIKKDSKILFVDDGSKDGTWDIIKKMTKNKLYSGVKLSRNRGQQNAILAGLLVSKKHADITISIDVDLQDDINVIDDMVKEYNDGAEIVYGVRKSRKKDSFFKRFTAEIYYKLMKLMGVELVFNHSECRLLSIRAIEGLDEFDEVNLFLRGIIPQIGYKTSVAYYDRNTRLAGKTKYSVKKLLKLAFEGITSFSVRPLKMITFFGILFFFMSIGIIIFALINKMLGYAVEGWTFLMGSIWLVAGIQMLSLGIIGEYIGKIYQETKKRPRFIIEEEII